MRIAFYAPLKPPTHATPSGDRAVARLFMRALEAAGHEVALASTLRSLDRDGAPARQRALRDAARAEARTLIDRWRAAPPEARPQAWFTYHVYHKAPDWIGPMASAALAIPYVIAEASFAPKRRDGPWALGHAAAEEAIRRADAVLAMTRDDAACLAPLVAPPRRLIAFPPFLDAAPYRAAQAARGRLRAALATAEPALDADAPWLIAVAMMRPGDKLASYRRLAAALGRIGTRSWRLLIVGDGPARADVEAAFAPWRDRVAFLGARPREDIPGLLAAADLFVWPAVNEAYGMAILEAQAAARAVVAGRVRGVADIVRDHETGLLVPADDDDAFAAAVAALLDDPDRRARLGARAAETVAARHDLAAAARRLDRILAAVRAGTPPDAAREAAP